MVAQPVEHIMTPLRDYVIVLSQTRGNTTLVMAPHRRPPTSANLIDEQTSSDEEWITQQEVAVGIPEIAIIRYITRCSTNENATDRAVPPGFTPGEVAGIQCYTNGKQAEGDIWYGDGSKLSQEVGGRTLDGAGGAITCGPVQVITRVAGPQTSYRAELQNFAINAALASGNQELTYDNKAVVDHAMQPLHRECSDMDLRLTIQEETPNKPLRSRWVPSHRDIAKAKTKEERTEIKHNYEVDRPAKMATGLPLLGYTPTHPGDIAVNGGPAPTPAKKWIIERRHYDLFSRTHWLSWLPLKGTRRMT